MNSLGEQFGERDIDRALARQPVHPRKARRHYLDREMAFAARVVPRMAPVQLAVVTNVEIGWIECFVQTSGDFRGDRAAYMRAHWTYIDDLKAKGSCLASAGKKQTRFHGRVEGEARSCAHPGCEQAGEYRAPPDEGKRPGFDGPGEWRWLCLDHVRAFNDRYNYFSGMSPDQIEAAQTPYGGWERETRAFSAAGSAGPRWADFIDPLDAIGARFGRAKHDQPDRKLSAADRKHLTVLGLKPDADRRQLRQRYLDLVRRYHPDKNGGDRSHEKALQAVIEAYTQLKSRPAFA